jgi:hypothetical protein
MIVWFYIVHEIKVGIDTPWIRLCGCNRMCKNKQCSCSCFCHIYFHNKKIDLQLVTTHRKSGVVYTLYKINVKPVHITRMCSRRRICVTYCVVNIKAPEYKFTLCAHDTRWWGIILNINNLLLRIIKTWKTIRHFALKRFAAMFLSRLGSL